MQEVHFASLLCSALEHPSQTHLTATEPPARFFLLMEMNIFALIALLLCTSCSQKSSLPASCASALSFIFNPLISRLATPSLLKNGLLFVIALPRQPFLRPFSGW